MDGLDFKKLAFIDGGKQDTGTYHIDDIVMSKVSAGLPIDFEWDVPFKGVGASFEMSTDPDNSQNGTEKVTNGGNDWEIPEPEFNNPNFNCTGCR